MRRAFLLTILVVGALTGSSSAASGDSATRPALRLLGTAPVSVSGVYFKRLELVRLTLTAKGLVHTRTTRASTSGRFLASFDGIAVRDKCSAGFAVVAVGARGSQATLKRPPLLCPPRGAPPPGQRP